MLLTEPASSVWTPGMNEKTEDRITVRMKLDMIRQIDAWIARQPGYVSRQEAVRLFVAYALNNIQNSNAEKPAPEN